ncbi:Wzz/FepE/Etk N-terminal domain-containing protein [Bosea sp. (in: a-proteobacteria)]|uniref:Wzz/FepE/Etk N-terminal domain-containing protein n=1 Tax=Bosea sp. (in: a-proteobacteria) TaxID=1871050 RepID=UPI0026147B7B|nr:Wzz/FepE/Etk N-terminal domain-containing protein [Bosea sp. (in: a-proteobacteria)]MCO5091020.1 AAA family ATPase [Bosea sp. (in: a-proteobacteria)]
MHGFGNRAQIDRRGLPDHDDGEDSAGTLLDIDFEQLIAAIRRQARLGAVIVAATLAIGLAYLITAVPIYTASTTILIDSRRNQDQIAGSIAELTFDTGAIDSQLEVIRSDRVAASVVQALGLDKLPEFTTNQTSVIGTAIGFVRSVLNVRNWFTSRDVLAEEEAERARRDAIDKLNDNMTVRRVARTYVLQISYSSPNPALAKQIADAFAEAYFRDQLEARFEITKRASGWMQDRLAELKESSLRTDLAVQRFKAERGIIATGQTSSGNQMLVTDQQLMELTTQLSTARSETAKAEAKLQQINDILRSGKADGAVTESLGNPVINDFRTRYLRASKTEADLSSRLGKNHFQVINLRNEMTQYERLIFEELQRIAETYVSDLEIARNREKSLNESMATLIGQKAVSNETMVQLRELDREAEVFKNLYQTFLQRYQDAIQRESLPTTEARVLSPAVLPIAPSAPRTGIVLALAGFLGLAMAGGIGALREFRDRVFRVGAQVRGETGLEFLGTLPAVEVKPLAASEASANPRDIQLQSSVLRHVLDAPLSSFAEVLRSAKVEVDLATAGKREGAKIVGVVSVLPGEGKTTTSKNFASLTAFLGERTLLIDADLRNPGLTRAIGRHAGFGLLEVLRGERSLKDAILMEPDSNLAFLPAVTRKRLTQSSEILTSREMEALLQAAGSEFDYIVVDLPPVGPVVDVRAAGRLFDGFVFVVEWGKTPRAVVRSALQDDPTLYDKCVGILFNKADTKLMQSYNKADSKYYYYGRYGKYYTDASKPSA